jgi:hypothetical protein
MPLVTGGVFWESNERSTGHFSPAPAVFPAPLFTPTPKAARRTLEFFTTQINDDHTRKAYLYSTRRFAQWSGTRN